MITHGSAKKEAARFVGQTRLFIGNYERPVLLRWPAATRGSGVVLLALTALVILAWWISSR